MVSDEVRDLYHEMPEAFEKLANAQDDNQVCQRLREVIEEENAKINQHQRVPADD